MAKQRLHKLHQQIIQESSGAQTHHSNDYFKRLWESWCQISGSSYSQFPGGILDNCVIWICQAASSTSQGLLMMSPYIQYSLHLYRETALSTQCLDSLLVGSMRFSRGCPSNHCLMMYGLLFGLSPPFTLGFIQPCDVVVWTWPDIHCGRLMLQWQCQECTHGTILGPGAGW